jgi:hypothetical protein
VALPVLTPEQRASALERAAESRRERADLKARLKSGALTFADVLAQAPASEVIARTKVRQILEALPGIGTMKAQALMSQAAIADGRRMAGLGHRQAEQLKALLASG